MINFKDLTVVIVTFRTDKNILFDCIKSIDKEIPIIIIENNNDKNLKNEVEEKFKNTKVILSKSNLGYGGGNNLGCENCETNYVFISNPDTIYANNFFLNLRDYINSEIDFSIIGASYNDNSHYLPYGGFSNKQTEKYKKNEHDNNGLKSVDWVVGCSMLINLKNIKTSYIFDENIFFFYDEIDLCRRIKNFGGKIYNSKKLIVNHLGHKGSIGSENDYKIESEKFRNWHLMWSQFYYNKKHDGYFFSLRKIMGKLINSLIKLIFFSMTNNYEKKIIYKYRLLGIINSILGKKSSYRIKN